MQFHAYYKISDRNHTHVLNYYASTVKPPVGPTAFQSEDSTHIQDSYSDLSAQKSVVLKNALLISLSSSLLLEFNSHSPVRLPSHSFARWRRFRVRRITEGNGRLAWASEESSMPLLDSGILC